MKIFIDNLHKFGELCHNELRANRESMYDYETKYGIKNRGLNAVDVWDKIKQKTTDRTWHLSNPKFPEQIAECYSDLYDFFHNRQPSKEDFLTVKKAADDYVCNMKNDEARNDEKVSLQTMYEAALNIEFGTSYHVKYKSPEDGDLSQENVDAKLDIDGATTASLHDLAYIHSNNMADTYAAIKEAQNLTAPQTDHQLFEYLTPEEKTFVGFNANLRQLVNNPDYEVEPGTPDKISHLKDVLATPVNNKDEFYDAIKDIYQTIDPNKEPNEYLTKAVCDIYSTDNTPVGAIINASSNDFQTAISKINDGNGINPDEIFDSIDCYDLINDYQNDTSKFETIYQRRSALIKGYLTMEDNLRANPDNAKPTDLDNFYHLKRLNNTRRTAGKIQSDSPSANEFLNSVNGNALTMNNDSNHTKRLQNNYHHLQEYAPIAKQQQKDHDDEYDI